MISMYSLDVKVIIRDRSFFAENLCEFCTFLSLDYTADCNKSLAIAWQIINWVEVSCVVQNIKYNVIY